MFGMPDYIVAVAILDTFVAVVVVRYYIKRRSVKEVIPIEPVVKGKTLHKCQHCDFVFEHPHKEIIYITTPHTVKLKCPKCGGILRTLAKGVCNIGLSEFEVPKVVEHVPEEVKGVNGLI